MMLEKDILMEWYKYQNGVMEVGAFGMPGGGGGGDGGGALDYNSGNYRVINVD